MRVIAQKNFPGLAALTLAGFGSGPERLAEFVDTLEPGVAKNQKWVMMVSTQFGCPVGCRMCDAGAMGYQGNLSAGEILSQIRHIVERNPELDIGRHPKVKIHFARMGEPALNPEVLTALRQLSRDFPYPGIIPSLSTVAPKSPAVDPFFEELIRVKNEHFPGGRFQLQFSLHSLDESRRQEIVPIRKWALEEVAQFGSRFVLPGDRKITLNFALAAGEEIDSGKLADVFPCDKFLIKITPINPTETAARNGAVHLWVDAPDSIKACARELKSRGFETIISPSLPEEITAETSCGQLWSNALKEQAAVAVKNRKREAESYVTAANLPQRELVWRAEIEKFSRRSLPLHPGKAGLLVVDMQELFLNPRSRAYLPPARAILGNARRLVEGFRRAGRPVYFTFHAQRQPCDDGGLMPLWWKNVCLEGTPEAKISAMLEPEIGRVYRKCRYSAFSEPALERALRQDGVEELVVAGVATNLCVESTVRGAFDLGFKATVAADAAAAHSEELHLASLKNMAFGFASISRTDRILKKMANLDRPIKEYGFHGIKKSR